MALSGIGPANRDTRSEWIRLRTLVLLRWMAIVGQLAALTVADLVVGMQLPLGLCYLVVGAAVIGNLVASFVFPGNKRFSEAGAMLTLLFDVSQLAILLALTGGLNNPFALLILVPVTISAGALELRTTVLLGLAAICLISVISVYNLPLRFSDGTILQVPAVFEFGFWLSIVIGIMFLALYSRRVATEIRSMSDALLATQMALAREQKLTDLGGVVAAAAHELGTPLATIKLASTELVEELADRPDLREDAELIRTQADRCRDILRSMGRAGKDDLHLRQAPLGAVLREAAEPHLGRGKTVAFDVFPGTNGGDRQPTILRRPEVIHGLRNLVQNAVDFARARVWIDATWTDSFISVRIIDDGAGYPSYILGRIGDPFVRSRPAAQETGQRPDYEGMGLGLFIAKTLLERSGAEISFANGTDPFLTRAEHPDRFGAIVEVRWPKSVIVAPETDALGPNRPLDG
ncbi:MAG: ActS/PrrB/RegB family redox-sensitive histidine kinase [Rhodobacter sp.]|nr:ActS/PrrB/RegB family redox-sensitive histidine kinase [Rhodobacter sp.]MCA3493463.1 ActS/PrrB/RegB family redox-sensitive histidine kinase [Rhodobacter sp.]MCA3499078.1 ActS/PrrB/RegB family redox-sensitive histidine kinase [Rhodobacter sp.]MCA3502707.1 ActS/PrrB/RegB family redox-sensitive histidine kinase [Rhodobacter sp.]MCA3516216.1 ActS/PrrB/RegB family redox-sensitive histidine kinase [Rhodobacter sp.]